MQLQIIKKVLEEEAKENLYIKRVFLYKQDLNHQPGGLAVL